MVCLDVDFLTTLGLLVDLWRSKKYISNCQQVKFSRHTREQAGYWMLALFPTTRTPPQRLGVILDGWLTLIQLINYLTAPNCVIWSSLLASAAVPGMLSPVWCFRGFRLICEGGFDDENQIRKDCTIQFWTQGIRSAWDNSWSSGRMVLSAQTSRLKLCMNLDSMALTILSKTCELLQARYWRNADTSTLIFLSSARPTHILRYSFSQVRHTLRYILTSARGAVGRPVSQWVSTVDHLLSLQPKGEGMARWVSRKCFRTIYQGS